MRTKPAEILREYGPFPAGNVGGVTYDGERVWYAGGDALVAFYPESGKTVRSIDVAAHAGTAFDGRHLYQIAEDRISKIDPATGRVLSSIPAPGCSRERVQLPDRSWRCDPRQSDRDAGRRTPCPRARPRLLTERSCH